MNTPEEQQLAQELTECWITSVDTEGNLVEVLDTGRMVKAYGRILANHTARIRNLENIAATQQQSIDLLTELVLSQQKLLERSR